jgi:hypothetical protein
VYREEISRHRRLQPISSFLSVRSDGCHYIRDAPRSHLPEYGS